MGNILLYRYSNKLQTTTEERQQVWMKNSFLLNRYQKTTDNTKQTTNNTKQTTNNTKQTTNNTKQTTNKTKQRTNNIKQTKDWLKG